MRPSLPTRLFAVLVGLFFLAPTLVIVGSSFSDTLVIVGSSFSDTRLVRFPPEGFTLRWYQEIVADGAWVRAFVHSLQTGVLAAVCAVVIGTALALAVAGGRGVPRGLLTTVAALPMLVPLVVVGLATYVVFVGLGLVGSVVGLALAHAALGVPYVFVNVLARLTALDSRIEDAARACGAGEVRTFFLVTSPLIAGGTVTGGLLAFATSWDEVVVAIFLATPQFHTLPVEIFGQLRSGVQPSTSAVSTLVTVLSLIILALTTLTGPAIDAVRKRRTRRSNP